MTDVSRNDRLNTALANCGRKICWAGDRGDEAYSLVEGQTEEAFVRDLLAPHYARIGLYLTSAIVGVSPGHKGGLSRYTKVKPQIERLCKGDKGAHVSTMFDLYALPDDFPGKGSSDYSSINGGRRKAEFLEVRLAENIGLHNFIPNLIVHEFEALLFSDLDAFEVWDDGQTRERLRKQKKRRQIPKTSMTAQKRRRQSASRRP